MQIDNGYFQFPESERNYSHLWKLSHNRIFDMILKESPSLEVLIQYARSSEELIPTSDIFFYNGLRNAIKYAYILAKCFNIDIEDAIEESVIELYKMKHNGKHFKNQYIYFKIYQIITRMSGFVYFPAHALGELSQIKKTVQTLEDKLRRLPTLREISIVSGMPLEKVELLLRMSQNPVFFSELSDEIAYDGYSQDLSEGEMIDELALSSDTTDTTVEQAFSNILRKTLLGILKKLRWRESKVLVLRYGLMDDKCRTLQEVGDILGLTRERIRQIEAKALRKLRNPARSKNLKGFLD